MAVTEQALTPELESFANEVVEIGRRAIRVLTETGTLSASRTLNFGERVPGEDIVVSIDDPEPWGDLDQISPNIATFDGTVLVGKAGFGTRYIELFRRYPEVTTVSHVHTPYLGAWAQTHRVYPIRYAASQRHTLAREIHPHIDRRQPNLEFILERFEAEPNTVGIFEGNGGANIFGRKGLLETAKLVVFLEEGAKFQAIAEGLGGSQEFGPGTLRYQWKNTGLVDEAEKLGLLP